MPSDASRNDLPGHGPSMKGPFIISVVFHLTILILSIIGIPYLAREPVITDPVSVELVNISDITQTTKIAPPERKPEEIKEELPPPAPEKPSPPQMKEDAPPDLHKPKEPEKVKDAKLPPPEELKAPDKEKKPEPKPPEKKPEPTKVEKPAETQDFQTLLKNLTPDTDTPEAEETPEETSKDATPAESQIAPLAAQITASELDALKQQLGRCWNVMAGAKYAEDLIVEIRVVINRDRTVQEAIILDQGRYNSDSPFRAAADAAVRALRNPQCSPLELPPEKYEEWKTTVIRFDPSQFL